MLSKKQIKNFQEKILEWYGKQKRDLPWRKSRDPYNILISEVMLQQTQVPRVIEKFTEWLAAFPTIADLAKASTRDVLLHWSGLGYNRRALYLKKLAETLVEKYHGIFPRTQEELQKLPGIGEYTANAILCFAFDKQVSVIDTNIRKVIIVHFFSKKEREQSDSLSASDKKIVTQKIREIAEELLPKGKAYEWNQALMDYASANLKKEKIMVPKQTPFKKSKRFYRGQILRLLLQKKQTPQQLFKVIINNGITYPAFGEILSDMEKDKLIKNEKGVLVLPD